MSQNTLEVRPYGQGRVSAARKTIASCADEFPGAFTVEELVRNVHRRDAHAGATATVYRAVAALEASGYLERVGDRDGSTLYARCARGEHHHHVVCEVCGYTAAAECPIGPSLLASVKQAGFTLTRHTVTLYGRCTACSARAESED